jgi:hypothetical protein
MRISIIWIGFQYFKKLRLSLRILIVFEQGIGEALSQVQIVVIESNRFAVGFDRAFIILQLQVSKSKLFKDAR